MHSQKHPQSHNQGPSSSGSKEGLSIYGLFHHLARTPQGKHRLRQIFLRPSLNIDVINERLNAGSVFLRPDNSGLLESMTRSLGQTKNMRTVVVHLRKGISNGMGKGTGGIKSGVWSSLRSVENPTVTLKTRLTIALVCISCPADTRCHVRDDGC